MRKVIIAIVLLVIVVPIAIVVARSATPIIDLPAQVNMIGQATPISVHVADPRGIRSVTASVEQNGASYPAWQMAQPSSAKEQTLNFTAGVKTIPQLKDGKAKLVVEATSNDLLHRSARMERDVTVVTQPPTVSADSEQHYIYIGMADLATFSVSGAYTAAGVRVGDGSFRAWPMPGGKPGLFSMYAFAWNMPQSTVPVVFASNGAGNDVTTPLTVVFPKKEQPHYTVHELEISDQFMQKVVGELDPNGTGDLVTRL